MLGFPYYAGSSALPAEEGVEGPAGGLDDADVGGEEGGADSGDDRSEDGRGGSGGGGGSTTTVESSRFAVDLKVCLLPGLIDIPQVKDSFTSSTLVLQLHREDLSRRAFHARNQEEFARMQGEAAAEAVGAGASSKGGKKGADKGKKAPAKGKGAAAKGGCSWWWCRGPGGEGAVSDGSHRPVSAGVRAACLAG